MSVIHPSGAFFPVYPGLGLWLGACSLIVHVPCIAHCLYECKSNGRLDPVEPLTCSLETSSYLPSFLSTTWAAPSWTSCTLHAQSTGKQLSMLLPYPNPYEETNIRLCLDLLILKYSKQKSISSCLALFSQPAYEEILHVPSPNDCSRISWFSVLMEISVLPSYKIVDHPSSLLWKSTQINSELTTYSSADSSENATAWWLKQ